MEELDLVKFGPLLAHGISALRLARVVTAGPGILGFGVGCQQSCELTFLDDLESVVDDLRMEDVAISFCPEAAVTLFAGRPGVLTLTYIVSDAVDCVALVVRCARTKRELLARTIPVYFLLNGTLQRTISLPTPGEKSSSWAWRRSFYVRWSKQRGVYCCGGRTVDRVLPGGKCTATLVLQV